MNISTIRNLVALCISFASLLMAQQSGIPSYSSYEDYCQKNPKAPTCINGKPITMQDMQRNAKKMMEAQRKSLYKVDQIRNPRPASPQSQVIVTPAEQQHTLTVRPDWAFAHPGADMLAGINVQALRESQTVRALLNQLAGPMHWQVADIDNFLARTDGVNQVWVSVRSGDSLILVQGTAQFPPGFVEIGNGLTSYRIAKNAIVIGKEASVLKAVDRLARPTATPSAAILRVKRLGLANEFWTTGTRTALSQVKTATLPPDLNAYSFSATVRDGVGFEILLQFAASAAARKFIESVRQDPNIARYPIKVNTALEGATVRVSASVTRAELSQALDRAIAGPLGPQLAALSAKMQKSGELTVVGLPGGTKTIDSSGKAIAAPAANNASGGIEIIYGSGTPHR